MRRVLVDNFVLIVLNRVSRWLWIVYLCGKPKRWERVWSPALEIPTISEWRVFLRSQLTALQSQYLYFWHGDGPSVFLCTTSANIMNHENRVPLKLRAGEVTSRWFPPRVFKRLIDRSRHARSNFISYKWNFHFFNLIYFIFNAIYDYVL